MINKYFTVEVKPLIDASLLNAAALASDDDVIFSWTPFEVPKGSSRLLNVTAKVASNDGTAQHHPFQLFFAKSKLNATTGHIEAPTSIGSFNTTATSQPSINEFLGGLKIETIDYMCQSLVGTSIASTGNSVAANGSNITMVLTPEGTPADKYWDGSDWVAITPGYDILWVAGIACGAMNFASTVTTDGVVEAGTTTTVHTDTKDANLVFSVGDVIQEVDNTIIGTITSIGAATGADVDITVDRGSAGKDSPGAQGIADGVKIYHRSPIKLVLSFEK
tara:strand:- start:331 stop:1161 length:831 start_codon:yes stop_codon:yes gene_type:complete